MRPSISPRSALVFLLLVAVLVVLFADALAFSAAADPLPAGGAALEPVAPASLSRSYAHSSFRVSSRLLDGAGTPIAGGTIDILQRVAGSAQTEGRVLGLVPPHGVVVEVLVYYLGAWQPIRTPRT